MDVETFRTYCLSKPATEECFPFDEVTLVFKVLGKMFALLPLDEIEPRANLKADPDWSPALREKYPQIIEGWHMSKKHWNTIEIENGLEDDFIIRLIDHSYDLVVSKLTKKQKAILSELGEG